ncbi:MAG: hypothetical protein HQK54_12260 [Oligoflexales bacterium]|nr:hypothetical protein [Oligoflexales bacterium]
MFRGSMIFLAGIFFLMPNVFAQSGNSYGVFKSLKEDSITIFGTTVRARNVIFVIDKAESMALASYKSGYSRWELLKSEFSRAIDGMKNDQKFNAVLFDTAYSYLLGEGSVLYPKVEKKANSDIPWGEKGKKLLSAHTPGGDSNLCLGIEKAFSAQASADAIIIITDGETNTGMTATYRDFSGQLGYTLKYVDEQATKQIIAIWVGGSLSSTYSNFMKMIANVPNADGSLPNPGRPAGMFVVPGQQ